MTISTCYPGKFNPHPGVWETHSVEATDFSTPTLTMVTYNVWFAEYYFQQRCEALLQLVKDCQADIICLQEVTPVYLDQILQQAWVQAGYYVSDYTGQMVDPYGVLLLSRLPIAQVFLHDLPTRMGRKLLVVEPTVNGQLMQIATVHLESIRLYEATRKRQLERIFPILARANHAALMGDFNFCSTWPQENTNLDLAYQDLWAVLRGAEPGYTEDTDINLMRLELTQEHKQVRFDRMLLRSATTPGWRPQSIELLGASPISPPPPHLFPSDHFGLVGKLVWVP